MEVSLIKLRDITKWILLALALTYIITGLGIAYFRIVEAVTFGLLTKNLSFRIHSYLLIPFLVFLISHVLLVRKTK
jgi:thiosulfate reductase cytochrome b subunit